ERNVQGLQGVNSKLEDDLVQHQARATREAEAFKRDVNNLNNELRKVVSTAEDAAKEKAEAVQRAETAIREKSAVENRLAAVQGELEAGEKRAAALAEKAKTNADTLTAQVALLKSELEKAITMAETAFKEKVAAEEKLTTIQKRWEQYMASK
ncbi:MAG: hypothetical protein HQK57_04655, partial [Deltaproteobacteria bacterium]|nr:hypothetical protein [Deltaproteobacteria bacterium]